MILFTENVIHCAFWLLLSFLGVAGSYVLVGADFLAVSQIVVYIGGVLILLLFGIMLTSNLETEKRQNNALSQNENFSLKFFVILFFKKAFYFITKIENILAFGLLGWLSVKIFEEKKWQIIPQVNPQTTLHNIGIRLLTEHFLAFELAGILLLVVLVCVLVFTKIKISVK